MLDNEEKKPALALILARLFVGMTVLFVLASSLDALLTFLFHFVLPHRKLLRHSLANALFDQTRD